MEHSSDKVSDHPLAEDAELVFRAVEGGKVRRGIRLEAIYWRVLRDIADLKQKKIGALVGAVLADTPEPANTTSLLRVYCLRWVLDTLAAERFHHFSFSAGLLLGRSREKRLEPLVPLHGGLHVVGQGTAEERTRDVRQALPGHRVFLHEPLHVFPGHSCDVVRTLLERCQRLLQTRLYLGDPIQVLPEFLLDIGDFLDAAQHSAQAAITR